MTSNCIKLLYKLIVCKKKCIVTYLENSITLTSVCSKLKIFLEIFLSNSEWLNDKTGLELAFTHFYILIIFLFQVFKI